MMMAFASAAVAAAFWRQFLKLVKLKRQQRRDKKVTKNAVLMPTKAKKE